jgi:hypothetical protein
MAEQSDAGCFVEFLPAATVFLDIGGPFGQEALGAR